jgi:hypothetical protein
VPPIGSANRAPAAEVTGDVSPLLLLLQSHFTITRTDDGTETIVRCRYCPAGWFLSDRGPDNHASSILRHAGAHEGGLVGGERIARAAFGGHFRRGGAR